MMEVRVWCSRMKRKFAAFLQCRRRQVELLANVVVKNQNGFTTPRPENAPHSSMAAVAGRTTSSTLNTNAEKFAEQDLILTTKVTHLLIH